MYYLYYLPVSIRKPKVEKYRRAHRLEVFENAMLRNKRRE
jgi:hypothetical protein